MILVTGGCGFIGSAFVLAWLKSGDEPIVNLDLLTYAGHPGNLQEVAHHPNYRFVHGDIGDAALVSQLLGGWATDHLGRRTTLVSSLLLSAGSLIALGAVVLRDLRAGPRSTYPLRRALGEVCELGVPTGLQFGAEMLAFTTFTAILSSIGAAQIAAHQIAIYVLRASFLPGIAVSEAGSVLIGQALGGKDLPRADRVHRAATRLAVGFMAVCGLVFAATGGRIVRIFSSDAEIVHVARNLLLVAAVFQVLDAAAIVLRASLRAAKDVKVVAVVGIAVAWTCIPGFAFVLGKLLGLGALGGWLGFIAETAIGSCVFYIRWKRGGWRARYV